MTSSLRHIVGPWCVLKDALFSQVEVLFGYPGMSQRKCCLDGWPIMMPYRARSRSP